MRDKAVLLLTEYLVENGYGYLSAAYKLTENVARAYALKLIHVAYQDNLRSRSYAGEKVVGKPHIDHRAFVHDNQIRVKRFFLFILDVATLSEKSQKTVKRLCIVSARTFSHSSARSSRRRRKHNLL